MRLSVQCSLLCLLLVAGVSASAPLIRTNASLSKNLAYATADRSDIPVLTASSFGFQCGTGKATNCPNAAWPTTVAQPGMIRLWDSQVQWHMLNTAPGKYDWQTLDKYLDTIAAHQPREAMYTFGYTPCWDTTGECEPAWGSTYPPNDLTNNGSASFNNFVLALLSHCSAAGHCVKDLIKYWEMWNEANGEHYWNGSVSQLYNLMAPAVALIHSHLPSALILTPPANRADTDWMQTWLSQENSRGRLSDIFAFHVYLQGNLPESRFNMIQQMVDLKNNTSGWSGTPWMNTETNFDARTFSCSSSYRPDDCMGQILRWHLLHFAYGARQLSWYFFNNTIGHNSDYSKAYHTMMEWLVGGRFTAACSVEGNTYTCPFTQANGHRALFVWNTRGDSAYNPAPEFVDYKTVSGSITTRSPGRPVTVGVVPIMLEPAN